MKIYELIKTVNGQRHGEVVARFFNIEDARKALVNELMYAGNDDCSFFSDKDEAEAEIDWAEDARDDWGDRRTDRYIDALREGIESGMPFIVDSVNGICTTIVDNRFRYDNYAVEIVESEKM